MKLAIGSDHRGFPHKAHLARVLGARAVAIVDCGCDGPASADYPDAALAVGELATRIVEIGPERLCPELVAACRARGVRVMVNYMGDDVALVEKLVEADFDMINTDNADLWLAAARAAGRHA